MDCIHGSLNRCRVDVWRNAMTQVEDVPLWPGALNDLVHSPTNLIVGCVQGLGVQVALNGNIAKNLSGLTNVDAPVEGIGVCFHFSKPWEEWC